MTGDRFQPAGRAPAPPPLDLVQDFVNTEIPEWERDDIATPAELEGWFRERGLLGAAESVTPEEHAAACELRAVLRKLALLNSVGAGPDDSVRRLFRSALSQVSFRVELAADGSVRIEPLGTGGARALGAIAATVAEARASGSWRRMKACCKQSCEWLFFDASRNCSSRWCSMSICGNRTKTSEYRRRRKAPS